MEGYVKVKLVSVDDFICGKFIISQIACTGQATINLVLYSKKKHILVSFSSGMFMGTYSKYILTLSCLLKKL